MSAQTTWTPGPATVNLGALAEVQIPEGYRFTDATGARILLERLKNPVPNGLAGILMPDSGTWLVVLDFAEVGYIRTSTNEHINAEAVLNGVWEKMDTQNKLRARSGLPMVKSIKWEQTPEFDPVNHTLECSIRVEGQTEKAVNHSIRLLGRTGVLVATALRGAQSAATPVPLKDLMKNVTFKEGRRYADYQPGDKIAGLDLSQLLTGDENPATMAGQRWWEKLMARDNPARIWVLCGLAAFALLVVGFLVIREILALKPARDFHADSGHQRNGKFHTNGHAANGHLSSRKKRAFNYQKFYSDMMIQVSTRTYAADHPKANGESSEIPNGTATVPQEPVETAAAQGAAAEFIAQQKDFIEEQRRLMQQQAKLIEERSRLIEEKNQLLAKQSEMLETRL